MAEIKVNLKNQDDKGWVFEVGVVENSSETKHLVEVEKSYYEKLTGGKIKPEELVKKSFKFLLKRESKEMILREFNLKIINQYFPEYEEEIGRG